MLPDNLLLSNLENLKTYIKNNDVNTVDVPGIVKDFLPSFVELQIIENALKTIPTFAQLSDEKRKRGVLQLVCNIMANAAYTQLEEKNKKPSDDFEDELSDYLEEDEYDNFYDNELN